ncbi:MAG: thioredoxin-disulfide reductase [Deltaproteobacteria bacterium]|jgi:thioredoxin reductase (NADPH)|nr:thioredoxin-disulfide reductase [Deltaproteobacteria bacterium]
MNNNFYDIIIIGGGPAGLTSGLYASRARLSTLLLERMALGGQVNNSEKIENYPGFDKGISGFQLAQNLEKQAKVFGLTAEMGTADELSLRDDHTKVIKTNGRELLCKALIIATGSEPNKLAIEREEQLTGRGVSYCATCDGPLYKDKEVAVVGGGDAAVEEALFLCRFAKKVHIIHRRDQLRAIKILQERILTTENAHLIWNTVVDKIEGDKSVESLLLRNVKDNKNSSLKVDGIFIYVGLKPNTGWLKNVLPLHEQGFIETNDRMETTLPGVFAAGDVRHKLLRQIATAVGDGSTAAFAAEKYLESIKT